MRYFWSCRTWKAAILTLLAGLYPNINLAQRQIPVRLSVAFQSNTVPLHAPVEASVHLENQSNETYTVDLGIDKEQTFTVIVKGPDGSISRSVRKLTEGLHSPGVIVIEPRTTYTQTILVNDWAQFNTPGVYHVSIQIDAPVTEEVSGRIRQTSGGDVTVSQPDDAYLKRECEQLLDTIKASSSYQDVIAAATTLSKIDDPIAAGFLTQAAELKPPVASILVAGLERLNTEDAIDGLVQLSKSVNPETRTLAVRSLRELQMAENNPELKERIRTGLSEAQH
jgi:hypothetical protein